MPYSPAARRELGRKPSAGIRPHPRGYGPAERTEKIHNITVEVTLNDLDTLDLPPAVQLGVYRILQEALTNVARHSGAKAVSILFEPSATALRATLSDNGRGFQTDATNAISRSHLGLQSIQERAAMLGGSVSFKSGSNGTTILLDIPLGSL